MGLDSMRIRLQIRRFFIVSVRTSYKSVLKHPFLVGLVCFLIFLYRSFPFLFSLLVSASPVLVCTAILLGTLLSFGEPNIPEIEKGKEEEEVSHEISSFRAGVLGDPTVVFEKDANVFVENFVGKGKDTAKEAIGEENWEKNRDSKTEGDVGLCDCVPLVDKSSEDIKFEKQVIEQVEREFDYSVLEKKKEVYEEKQGNREVLTNGEAIENHYSLIQNVGDENLRMEEDKSAGDFIEAEKGHQLDDKLSSWKQVNDDDDNEEEEEEKEDEASDSGSDGAESSSPDASMADIIPMLDELHPLLDEETPQPACMSHEVSDAGSECSHKSNENSVMSEEDIEKQADEEEDGDDDNDNEEEEEEEEVQEGKEDESTSAIKWTEDDQKNLMDLGTLELERNQRLESLIARRRARRNMRLIAEKNLIDLDGADLPLNVRPISTMRRNPFDIPYDSYDDVPGSAPSVLLPRRNPFDLPYDSNEEKPDLKGDSFQQEFSSLHHRETLFRRHESFSVGPSVWGPKQERQDLRWKPYFVPERFASEETSYTFQRQLSEASESKVSSVPDTESVSSAVEEEDKKLNEEDLETEMIPNLDNGSVLVEHGSLSSEDIDSVDIENIERRDVHHDGEEIILGDAENHNELDSNLSILGGATPIELNTSEILLRMDPGEEEYTSRSSLSSLSEVDEKPSDVKKRSMSPDTGNSQIEESHISTQTSLDSDFHFMSDVVDQIQDREPVLDPRGSHTTKAVGALQMSFDSDFHFTSGVDDENRHIEPVFVPTGDPIGDSRILMQASLDSDSHFKTVVVDNDQPQQPVLEPSDNLISTSCISTQTSLNSDFNVTSGMVDDNQHQEPVYDSSPRAVDKFLSFSSISPDTQGETSEMGSLPALAEFAGKESEVHAENIGKDTSSQKEAYEGSSKEYSLYEIESNSREVTEIEPDVAKVGLSGDNLVLEFQSGKNGFMKSELMVERDAAGSPPSSSNNGSVKKDLEYKEASSNHELEELYSSSPDAETIVKVHQDVIDNLDSASSDNQMASEETILHALEEQHPPVAVVSVDSKLFSLESESVEKDALQMEGVPRPQWEEVLSSGLVASRLEHMPSNDLNLSENDERQPAVVAEQVLEAHPDASSSEIKHVEELSLRKERGFQFKQDQVHSSSSDAMISDDFLQDADGKLVSLGSSYQHVPFEAKSPYEAEKQLSWSDISVVEPSINADGKPQEPSLALPESTAEVSTANNLCVPEVFNHDASESASVPPEILEQKSELDEVDIKVNILDKIVYEDSRHILENPNYSAGTHNPFFAEENINEDEDVVKEIVERLLSELDTVGDFSVKEVVGESLHDQQIPGQTIVGIPEYNSLPRDPSVPEIKRELPVLEVRSVTDIDLAFKQLHEGVDVEEVILPSMIEDQRVVDKGPDETNSDLRVVEARSLEDLHVAMKQASKRNIEEKTELFDLVEGPAGVNEAGSGSSTEELPVLEVRTMNDVELAFKQLNEGVDIEEVIIPSTIEQHLGNNESRDPQQSGFDLRVVEATSLEDLHIAMKQASQENIEERSKPSDIKNQATEVSDVGSSSSTMELPVLKVGAIDNNNGMNVDASRDLLHSSSDLQVLEAISVEDFHSAMKQVSEVNIEELPKSSDSSQELLETSEKNEMGPTKDIEPGTTEATEAGK